MKKKMSKHVALLLAADMTAGSLAGCSEMCIRDSLKRFPKHEPVIQRNFELLRTRGAAGIFISKLIQMCIRDRRSG